MNHILSWAAVDLDRLIKEYGVIVNPLQGTIMAGDTVIRIKPEMSREKCKREIRRAIKLIKEVEAKKLQDKQSSLLGGS